MSETIYTYTSEQATDDGILFNILRSFGAQSSVLRKILSPKWKRGPFSHVTVNLMGLGYYNEDSTVNIPNLIDLLNQSLAIVRSKSDNFTKEDWFFSGEIELPSGAQQQIFICQNETGKYTLMLPSDY